jgi:hypothetical protein
MKHAYLYSGPFELNYPTLTPGTTSYRAPEREAVPLVWPAMIDGVRASFMERTGRKCFVVRVQYADHDVVLDNPVYLDPVRHMNNRRPSSDAMIATDDEASALLDDIIRENPGRQHEIGLLISQINQIRRNRRMPSA